MKLRSIFVAMCLLTPGVATATVYQCQVIADDTVIGEMKIDSASQEPAAIELSSDHFAICTGSEANGLDLLVCGQVNLNGKQRIFYGGHQILNLGTDVLHLSATLADAGLLLSEGHISDLKTSYTTICVN